MKIIKVEGGVMPVGQGDNVLLTKSQYAARRHAIAKFEEVGDTLLCVPNTTLEFKSGEFIGVDEVPKGLIDVQRHATAEDGEDAVALLAAAETLNPPPEEPVDGADGETSPRRRRR